MSAKYWVCTLFRVVSNVYQVYSFYEFKALQRFAYVRDINYLHRICWGLTYTPLLSSASRSREDKTRTRGGGHSGRCGTASNRKGTSLIFYFLQLIPQISRLGMNPTSKISSRKAKFVVQNFSMVLRKRFFVFVDDCVFFKGSLNPVFFVLTCKRKKTGNPMIDELGSDDLKARGKQL